MFKRLSAAEQLVTEDMEAKNTKYFGNIKFCQSFENKTKNSTDQFNLLTNKKTWCALSTHQDEELFCANVHRLIQKSKKMLPP